MRGILYEFDFDKGWMDAWSSAICLHWKYLLKILISISSLNTLTEWPSFKQASKKGIWSFTWNDEMFHTENVMDISAKNIFWAFQKAFNQNMREFTISLNLKMDSLWRWRKVFQTYSKYNFILHQTFSI